MKKIKKLLSMMVMVILVSLLVACSNDKKNDESNNSNYSGNNDKSLNGSITMSGSTSMEKLSNVLAEAFMTKYPEVIVNAEFVGSSAGIEQVLAGAVDIGNASRNLKTSEKEAGAVENVVAIDGIAVIVDKANTVVDLSKDQLVSIYKGTINNWVELGGANQPIVVIGRESGSGTRGAFEEILDIEDQCKYSNEINSTGGVMAKVASTPGAIGYVSLDIIDETVSAVALDGVAVTSDNIKAGDYFLSRPFVMATAGEISDQSEIVRNFFEFISSDEGKELIEKVGLISVN
ncbi:MAG: phosphate ABC transporter substrate-binding protein [Clostridiales bacterium]|jgi:phosphate transport system substrate-binding protein|nr:phosphate ABC transporter substrate-binding protein [Bacillota bacterium]NLK04357.1 phosphate ABC transporter substrate-binding protein [Clostridiales bacterium]